jgi:hypothetical protein
MDIIKRLRPVFSFCGHHHRPAVMRIENTETRALNIIARDGQEWVNPGWAWIGSWDGAQINETGFWPNLNVAELADVRESDPQAFLKGITSENVHSSVDFGPAVGKEEW